jgi:hypothetical protein
MMLGKEMLSRPVIVSTREDNIQILDLKTGFVICLNDSSEVLPKLMSTFSNEKIKGPKMVSSVEKTEHIYKEVVRREINDSSISRQLYAFKEVMYKPGNIEDRISLVQKTIKVLENHKLTCDNGEGEKVDKATEKLNRIITYLKAKRLAPGQVPSVYEIAIWHWIN